MGAARCRSPASRSSVGDQVKPLLDRTVNEQVAALTARIRNDPALELAARREWAKMCRSISLKGVGATAPDLWLEVRPTRAFAAQPRIDQNAVTLTLGVQAETRITPAQTKPDCPFPAQLQIVQQPDAGRISRSGCRSTCRSPTSTASSRRSSRAAIFPRTAAASSAITVLGASIAPSGDRLLISLRVKAREQKTFFGFGAEANIYVWGRPVLDRDRQILRLTDIALDVQSEAASACSAPPPRRRCPTCRRRSPTTR